MSPFRRKDVPVRVPFSHGPATLCDVVAEIVGGPDDGFTFVTDHGLSYTAARRRMDYLTLEEVRQRTVREDAPIQVPDHRFFIRPCA